MTFYAKILSIVLKQPKLIYSIILLLVMFTAINLPNIQIDTDPENMLSQHDPARAFHQSVKNQFAINDMIVVGAVSETNIFTQENLATIHAVTEYALSLKDVVKHDVNSISTVDNISQILDEAGNNQGIKFSYLMKSVPTSIEQVSEIQQAVKRLPSLHNTIVSSDNKAIAIYVPVKSKTASYAVAEQIRSFIGEQSTALSFHITGLPVAEDQFGVEMFVQMAVAAPLAGLAIFLLLWVFFRNIPLIIAPMIVAMATVLIIMGSLIGMGFTVHIMSSMIAIFLMPIAVVDSVHILSEFADKYKKGSNVKATLKDVMSHLYKPMLLTSVTSAVGFYSLMLTPIPPVKVFGGFIGTGILLAFALTIVFVPAYISRLSAKNLAVLATFADKSENSSLLRTALTRLGLFAKQKHKEILLTFICIFAVSIVGISRIEINDNPVNWFKKDHEIRVADKALNQHFAGTYDAWLVLEPNASQSNAALELFKTKYHQLLDKGFKADSLNSYISQHESLSANHFFQASLLLLLDDIQFEVEPHFEHEIAELIDIADQAFTNNKIFIRSDVLTWMSFFQQAIIDSGLVGKVNALNDIVKVVNRELKSGEDKDYVIPNSPQAVAQTLLQFQSSHRPQDLWHFVTADYQKSLMWLQLTSGDNQHMSKVITWVDNYIADNPLPANLRYQWAGKTYLNVVWQDAMVSGMIDSLLSSFVVVFLMMVALFRSIKYGVLAMLPLTFTITMIYGLIGWLGKSYDMPIAVLSALTLGLSIDFAIHFLQRTKELEAELGSISKALTKMFDEPARAISRNAIVIAIGFTPLLLSPLVPYITVGLFLASIMAVSALVTLVLLPALMTMFFNDKEVYCEQTTIA